MLLAFAAPARAEDPAVVAVEPARRESLLVCRLRTQGLPGEKILSTLHSGLASAIDLQLEVAAADGRVVASRVVRLRLVYDLWEEVFVVTHDGAEARVDDDDALAGWLAEPPWLPVAPLAALAGSRDCGCAPGLQLHTIEPSERTRLEEVVAGPEDHEVSVGLGTLIRFFYKGGRDEGERAPPCRFPSCPRSWPMRRIRTRLLGAILLAALLPAIPATLLVRDLLQRSQQALGSRRRSSAGSKPAWTNRAGPCRTRSSPSPRPRPGWRPGRATTSSSSTARAAARRPRRRQPRSWPLRPAPTRDLARSAAGW